MKRFIILSFLITTLTNIQLSGQCLAGLSPNMGFADASSYVNCSSWDYCGITAGAWIGAGSLSGSVTYLFNPPTSYIEVDFNAVTLITTNGVIQYEYLEFYINGSFVDLNTAPGYTFIQGLPGCTTSPSPYFVTSPGNLGYSGIPGVIEPLGPNGTGIVQIDIGCEINSIEIKNINMGPTQGTVLQIRRCLDNATGSGSCGSCNLSSSITSTDAACYGEATGTATANPINGTAPYTYTWSNNLNTQTINNLAPGSYSVTITDASGCSDVGAAVIDEPDELSVIFSTSEVGCDSLNDGTATAINDGGLAPFTYQWDASSGNQTTSTASNLATGVYKVTLTDANGCEIKAGTTVLQDDCEPPCPIDPCVEAVINNTDICTAISNDPADPLATLDCDGDGVANADECTDGTDPLDPCDYEDTSITLPVTADQSGCPEPCPDLTPIMTILPGNIAGMSAVEVAVQVSELDSVDTDGSIIIVRIPSDPRLVFVWNIGLTQAALVPVQNSDWNYLGDNGFVHTWTYNGPGLIIPANGGSAFGFQSFYDPQSTDGQTTLTTTILPFSGGECDILNNTDSERLVYFQ